MMIMIKKENPRSWPTIKEMPIILIKVRANLYRIVYKLSIRHTFTFTISQPTHLIKTFDQFIPVIKPIYYISNGLNNTNNKQHFIIYLPGELSLYKHSLNRNYEFQKLKRNSESTHQEKGLHAEREGSEGVKGLWHRGTGSGGRWGWGGERRGGGFLTRVASTYGT